MMKNMLKIGILLFVFSVSFTSCRDQNKDKTLDEYRDDGADVKVKDNGDKVKIKTDDKTIKIKKDDNGNVKKKVKDNN